MHASVADRSAKLCSGVQCMCTCVSVGARGQSQLQAISQSCVQHACVVRDDLG